MNIDLVADGKLWRIRFTSESAGIFGSFPITDELLVPEARKLRDKLDAAIKEAERRNKPQRKAWDVV